jgi:hypothetical protein
VRGLRVRIRVGWCEAARDALGADPNSRNQGNTKARKREISDSRASLEQLGHQFKSDSDSPRHLLSGKMAARNCKIHGAPAPPRHLPKPADRSCPDPSCKLVTGHPAGQTWRRRVHPKPDEGRGNSLKSLGFAAGRQPAPQGRDFGTESRVTRVEGHQSHGVLVRNRLPLLAMGRRAGGGRRASGAPRSFSFMTSTYR